MAKKSRSVFVCQNCGNEQAKWVGQCPSCNEWNTLQEFQFDPKKTTNSSLKSNVSLDEVSHINTIGVQEVPRFTLSDQELNRVLGGGLVPGSVTLLGGEPGIGKSTLLLQLALNNAGLKTLYISGEESKQQIKLRADRLGLKESETFLLTETNTQTILQYLEKVTPELLVIDSIQTLHSDVLESAPGTISQIRESAAQLIQFAKATNTPLILIGHITKEGNIAGPKILEHMVDTVLQFEGDQQHVYRLIRAKKNRFGNTNELGIYEMHAQGLREVSNPSKLLGSLQDGQLSGSCIGATVEGNRPLLIEVQALVSSAAYGTPQRSSTGFDLRRLNMLLAVLEKRCGFKISQKDVFLNMAGGLRVEDTAIDLAVISAILSSSEDIPCAETDAFAGEVGLSGEIRPVSHIEQRIGEANKMGFEKIWISKYQKKSWNDQDYDIEICQLATVVELFEQLFG